MRTLPLFPLFFFLLYAVHSTAQQKQDSVKLPFAIAKEKRLSDEDLSNKKEGAYVTGVPDVSSDPINGFGAGVEGSLFFDGKKNDPFFAYTPYRSELSLAVFYTTKEQREFNFKLDVPYIFRSKWRLFAELGYGVDPNLLYFGTTERSLEPLSYFPGNDSTKPRVTHASYEEYNNSLTGSRTFYNTYQQEEKLVNVIFMRTFLEGKMRALGGYEFALMNISSPRNANSFLAKDAAAGKIPGFGDNHTSLFQVGLIYDTRDLEDDPSKGILAEVMNELSRQALGSEFNFNKLGFHFNLYQPVWKRKIKRCVFAFRFGIISTQGNAPIQEYPDLETSDQTIKALGGGTTLRGYKEQRFIARVMAFSNFELRLRFTQFNMLRQHFAFSAVPFFDAGGAWDDVSRMGHTENLRYSEGLGLHITWNNNTLLRFDYALSKEDRQFFFGLGQTF